MFIRILNENTIERLLNTEPKIELSPKLLEESLEKSDYQSETMKKLLPWFEAHFELITEIQ
jgi:hypothetical protein